MMCFHMATVGIGHVKIDKKGSFEIQNIFLNLSSKYFLHIMKMYKTLYTKPYVHVVLIIELYLSPAQRHFVDQVRNSSAIADIISIPVVRTFGRDI